MRMDDHGHSSADSGHWGLSSALLHEMPPDDMAFEDSEGLELNLVNIAVTFALGIAVAVLMFVVGP